MLSLSPLSQAELCAIIKGMNEPKRFFANVHKFLCLVLVALAAVAVPGCYSDVPVEDESVIGLASIQITKPAEKTIYRKGDRLDTKGLEITATYRNGATKVVSGWTVSGFDSSQDVSSQNVIVMYAEGNISRFTEYNIQYANLSGISITHPAAKVIYSKGDSLDTRGLEITASYKNGMSQVVKGWTVSGFDSSKDVTNQTLTVTYKEGELSFSVQYTIQYADLTGITVTTPPRKTKYRVGDYSSFASYRNRDFLNFSELVLTVSKSDGSSEVIDLSKVESDVLIKDASGRIMVEFLDAAMEGPCKNYYDIPRSKPIDLGNGRTLVFSGYAFIKEDANPQIIVQYTEDVNGTTYSRYGTFGISMNYEPTYRFTDAPIAVDGKNDHYYLGDYPQSAKAAEVLVCNKSMDRGYFKYYVGSDGNYYVKLVDGGESYFKVEPIEWYKKNVDTETGNHFLPVKAIEGGIPFSPANDWMSSGTLPKREAIVKTIDSASGENEKYNYSWTYKYYFLANTYHKSYIADFLNGTNDYGTGVFSGKGFYQTAFSNEAVKCINESTLIECTYFSAMETYTDYGNPDADYWRYFEGWANISTGLTYVQKVALADDILCKGDAAWELTDYVKQKNVTANYMVTKNAGGDAFDPALFILNYYDTSKPISNAGVQDIFYLDSSMTLQHTALNTDNLCIIPTIMIRGK